MIFQVRKYILVRDCRYANDIDWTYVGTWVSIGVLSIPHSEIPYQGYYFFLVPVLKRSVPFLQKTCSTQNVDNFSEITRPRTISQKLPGHELPEKWGKWEVGVSKWNRVFCVFFSVTLSHFTVGNIVFIWKDAYLTDFTHFKGSFLTIFKIEKKWSENRFSYPEMSQI